jgi:hypothetical protein
MPNKRQDTKPNVIQNMPLPWGQTGQDKTRKSLSSSIDATQSDPVSPEPRQPKQLMMRSPHTQKIRDVEAPFSNPMPSHIIPSSSPVRGDTCQNVNVCVIQKTKQGGISGREKQKATAKKSIQKG